MSTTPDNAGTPLNAATPMAGAGSDTPIVGLVMGSDSDWPVMEAAAEALAEFGIPFEADVVSAHRMPTEMIRYGQTAHERGLRVMDTTALSLCMDNRVPIHVFELAEGNIVRVASGERIGTIVTTPKEA